LQNATQRHLQQRRQWLQHLSQRAHSVSPLAVLGRGYALVSDEQGQLLRSVNATAVDSVITARLHDGEVSARVLTVKELP
ncbi:MAG: exodeoxyribonuclease VII large subunit, partial [Paraperlucidibaca sp.]|nr:exodeoxyribonuclease VII large subunit [Paraperlucidibaca sp.]